MTQPPSPKPWSTGPSRSRSYKSRGRVEITDANGDVVAWVRCGRKTSVPNAKMLAAAPSRLNPDSAMKYLKGRARELDMEAMTVSQQESRDILQQREGIAWAMGMILKMAHGGKGGEYPNEAP